MSIPAVLPYHTIPANLL